MWISANGETNQYDGEAVKWALATQPQQPMTLPNGQACLQHPPASGCSSGNGIPLGTRTNNVDG